MAPRKSSNDNPLLSALRFVALAQSPEGTPFATHCRFIQGHLIAFDGILAAGVWLGEGQYPDICPNTFQLITALDKATDANAITFLADNIAVKTAKFSANVQCLQSADLQFVGPDALAYGLTDAFRDALVSAAIFTKEGAQRVAYASVITRNGSCMGTNGRAFIEVWHGQAMPDNLILPKTFIDVLEKCKKKIVGFGFSETSFTIWFDDHSWIKTQLYSEQWPSVDLILAWCETARQIEVPKALWEAVHAVAPFSKDKTVYFRNERCFSHPDDNVGASFKCDIGVAANFDFRDLQELQKVITSIDFAGNDRAAIFFGKGVRGAISRRS